MPRAALNEVFAREAVVSSWLGFVCEFLWAEEYSGVIRLELCWWVVISFDAIGRWPGLGIDVIVADVAKGVEW